LRLTGSAAIDGFGNIYDNTLTGNGAANVLDGGLGNDTLIGGGGNDTYRFARSGGSDRIIENDSTLGNQDTLAFDSSVTHDQLWFSRAANDLQIRIIGTQDTVTVQDWYLGSAYHVEQFRAGDGKLLLDSQVQGLVQAMAQFSPPAVGQITTTTAQQAALMPQLAAAWR
jgi:Ca2+-binding RTX toxin-like protein